MYGRVVTPILGDVQEAPDHSEWDVRLGRVSGKTQRLQGDPSPGAGNDNSRGKVSMSKEGSGSTQA